MDDAEALKFFGADARDDLYKIASGGIIRLENGFAAFPKDDPLPVNIKAVKPLKTFFDVAMHGSSTAVGYGTLETNMSPRLLASVIRHMDGWNGQNIRLLSCSTGKQIGEEYCFAEELANALGVIVKAPTDTLYKYSRMAGFRSANETKKVCETINQTKGGEENKWTSDILKDFRMKTALKTSTITGNLKTLYRNRKLLRTLNLWMLA